MLEQKRIFLLGFLVFTPFLHAACPQDAKLSAAWDAFQKRPSASGARKVDKLLPRERAQAQNCSSWANIRQALSSGTSSITKEVKEGKRPFVRLAFHFWALSDGALAESFDEDLGNLISTQPKLFLLELQRASSECRTGLVANLGDYGAMEAKEAQKVLSQRFEALQGVNSAHLRTIRARCLSSLTTVMKR